MTKNKHQKRKRNRVILVLLTTTILATACVAFFYFSSASLNDSPANTSENSDINYGPPTEEERKAGDNRKDDITKNESYKNDNSSNSSISVIITDARQYGDVVEVRAFIPNHYQDGTCTITFTQDTAILTKESPAYRDASTTICTNPLIKRSDFPSAGKWQLQVTYRTPSVNAKSEQQVVTID